MKVLSIIVPCYNSQDYMHYCIESLLLSEEAGIEIIIVNDGSVDGTGGIADQYAARYPGIIRVVHKENGGHGDAVNAGLREASGLYFKVVDSDDWVDRRAYLKVLESIRTLKDRGEGALVDLIVTNYVYEKEGARFRKVVRYRNVLPENQACTWEETRPFRNGQYLMMHSVIFRTELLRQCGLELPKHTFYVDNLFVFLPLSHVKTLYYVDADLYRYYIGREDQSVNEMVMIKRLDQQLRVNRIMIDKTVELMLAQGALQEYLYHHLEIITVVSSILLIRSGSGENLRKKNELWRYIRDLDEELYRELRKSFLGVAVNLPGVFGRRVSVGMYKVSRRIVGFN